MFFFSFCQESQISRGNTLINAPVYYICTLENYNSLTHFTTSKAWNLTHLSSTHEKLQMRTTNALYMTNTKPKERPKPRDSFLLYHSYRSFSNYWRKFQLINIRIFFNRFLDCPIYHFFSHSHTLVIYQKILQHGHPNYGTFSSHS